jgi:hypothetical protein
MLRIALAAVLAGSAPLAAQAPAPDQQSPAPASLGWFHGEWEGDAIFLGRPAKVRLLVRPALDGTATALAYTADVAAEGTRPAVHLESQGTYRVKADGSVSGQWADSFGNFHALAGRAKSGELRVTWGDARSEVGHSSYVLSTDGVLTVTDSAFTQGAVRVFASAKYRRRT